MISWVMRTKKYRSWAPDQAYLFPPTANDLLPDDHLVFFVRDLLNELDLSPSKSSSTPRILAESDRTTPG